MKLNKIFIITIIFLSVLMLTSVSASENMTDLSVADDVQKDLSIDESDVDVLEMQDDDIKTDEIQSFDGELEKLKVTKPKFKYEKHIWSKGKYNVSVTLPEDYNGNGVFALDNGEFNCTIINGKGIIELPEFETFAEVHDYTYKNARFNYVDNNNENYSSFSTLDFQVHSQDPNDFSYINRNNLKNFFIDNDPNNLIFAVPYETGGIIDLYINDEFQESKEYANNVISFSIPSKLGTGTYTYRAFLHDNLYYDDVNLTGDFNINAIDLFNIEYLANMEDESGHVLGVKVAKNATGYVNISFKGNDYSREYPNELLYGGYNRFSLFDEHEGDYQGTVTYSGDLNNYPVTLSFVYKNIITQSDKKAFTYFAITSDNMYENEDHVISIDLPKDAKGSLIVWPQYKESDEYKEYTEKLINGSAKITIPYSSSINSISGRYDGRDYYVAAITEYVITKPKLNITAMATREGLLLNFSDNTDGCVKIDYENESYIGFVTSGMCFIPDFHPVDKIVLSYAESDKARAVKNEIIPVEKLEIDSELTVDASDITLGETAAIKISIIPEITGSVLISLNNANYTVDIANGTGILEISDLNAGDYVVNAIYMGDSYIKAANATTTFKVKYAPVIKAKSTSVLYSAKSKYSVTVYGEDGKLANGINVVFKIAGKQVAKVKTKNGVASYTVTKTPGKYKISVEALGKTVTKTLTVKHVVTLKQVKVKKSAKKLVLTATLAKVNKKYLKNKKVTFKFNGKKYTAKTNKKGVAKVTIKKTALKKLKVNKKVTYQVTYLKDTVKMTAKVKK